MSVERVDLGVFPSRQQAVDYALARRFGQADGGASEPLKDGISYIDAENQHNLYMSMSAIEGGWLKLSTHPNDPTFAEQLAAAVATGSGLIFSEGGLNLNAQRVIELAEQVFNARRVFFNPIPEITNLAGMTSFMS